MRLQKKARQFLEGKNLLEPALKERLNSNKSDSSLKKKAQLEKEIPSLKLALKKSTFTRRNVIRQKGIRNSVRSTVFRVETELRQIVREFHRIIRYDDAMETMLVNYAILEYLTLWLMQDKNATQTIKEFIQNKYNREKTTGESDQQIDKEESRLKKLTRAADKYLCVCPWEEQNVLRQCESSHMQKNMIKYSYIFLRLLSLYEDGECSKEEGSVRKILKLMFFSEKGLSSLKRIEEAYDSLEHLLEGIKDLSSSDNDVEYVVSCMQFCQFEKAYRFLYYGELAQNLAKATVPTDHWFDDTILAYTRYDPNLEPFQLTKEYLLQFFAHLPREYIFYRIYNPKKGTLAILDLLKSRVGIINSRDKDFADALRALVEDDAFFFNQAESPPAHILFEKVCSVHSRPYDVKFRKTEINALQEEFNNTVGIQIYAPILHGTRLSFFLHNRRDVILKNLISPPVNSGKLIISRNEANAWIYILLEKYMKKRPICCQPSWKASDFEEAAHFLKKEFDMENVLQPLELRNNRKHGYNVYKYIQSLLNNSRNIDLSKVNAIREKCNRKR